MKKIKNLVFSGWSFAAFTIVGPVAVCLSSIIRAIIEGYSLERPLWSLLAIVLVTLMLYVPVARAKSISEFEFAHEFDFGQRVVFGGFALCFIAIFPELEQSREFGYTNHIMMWLFQGWVAFAILFWVLVIAIYGLGIGLKSK